jgi:enamine deaminase RidA (YjgF/YER057c/UK114 family)
VVREIRDRHIDPAQPPASTAVQVAALFRPGYLIEIDALAVVQETAGPRSAETT